ncbi:4670_t:CDS:2 [Funneliformis mosseae]|uniref:4670_t:CDS:1 n=1 Tax=Funneliformis mosseae TaxID=27381 RepID=A0A9N8WHL1_FUNMO|nr:4670_t:CDS:2 [Funneliformis mosseae]
MINHFRHSSIIVSSHPPFIWKWELRKQFGMENDNHENEIELRNVMPPIPIHVLDAS